MKFSTLLTLTKLLLLLLNFSVCLSKTVVFSAQNKRESARLKTITKIEEHSVVPDVVDIVPEYLIEVKYPSGAEVSLGNELTPTNTKDVPEVKWPFKQNTFYTLAMVDPDAPTRQNPTHGPFNHWLVINIPGIAIVKGETLAEYVGAGAPKDTGLHRYVFLVYKQQSKIELHSETPLSNRAVLGRIKFEIREFAKKYSLSQPIAANFFQAQYDDYVQILHKQFNSK